MKVERLKQILSRALDVIEGFDDNQEVKLVSNTYFLGDDCRHFLGISGYDGGYINLDDPVDEEDDDEACDDYIRDVAEYDMMTGNVYNKDEFDKFVRDMESANYHNATKGDFEYYFECIGNYNKK